MKAKAGNLDQEEDKQRALLIREIVRAGGLPQSSTTQMFVAPTGNWTQSLMKTLQTKKATRSCWVRGPYPTPFASSGSHSQFILVASGIGITPALAVLHQQASC